MKKQICNILIFSTLIISVPSSAQKIAHINLDSLLKNMPESDSARKVGQGYYTQLENTIESMQKEYQQKVQDYQQNSKSMTDLVKETKGQEINELGGRIQNFQQQAQASLQKFNDSITRPIINKAKGAVKKVAEERGYKYVLDDSMLIYFDMNDKSDDIYDLVADKLGVKPKSHK